ncbi:MAG: rhodanese-like domain-containing protein [Erysipelotrichaceae bacterium]
MKKTIIVFILVILVGCSSNSIKSLVIDSKQAKTMMDSEEVVVVDVRTKEEFDEGHISKAINIPLDEIEKIDVVKDKKILVYCRSGNRSATASSKLVEMGYEKVYDFGGIKDWPYEVVIGE